MKLKEILRIRRGPLIALLLTLIGAGLLGLSARVAPTPYVSPLPAMPTAPWLPMPTRASQPNPPDTAALEQPTESNLTRLQHALLTANLNEAQHAWDALQDSGEANTAAAQVAGARLALLSGDFERAEQRAIKALELQEASSPASTAAIWSLLGVIYNRQGKYADSEQALALALELDPSLVSDLFSDRWKNAVRTENADLLAELAGYYSIQHPQDKLEPYYRAAALLADNQPQLALGVLLQALKTQRTPPALLWYTAGEAYLTLDAFANAATALEVAASQVAHGDSSLSLITTAPIDEIGLRLARAYLASDRCVEAESLYQRLSAFYPDLTSALEQAIICQTPTPTPTHWIIRLQPATPTAQP